MKLTASRPGARFSFSPMIFWLWSSSTSLIEGALSFVTVKVTGPACASVVSRAQVSLPPSLLSVTLTCDVPSESFGPLPFDEQPARLIPARTAMPPATSTRV